MTKEEINEKAIQLLIEDLENENPQSEIDFPYHIEAIGLDFEEMSFDDIKDQILDELNQNGAFDIDIIYYGKAIEYLRGSDASLQKSIGIAEEMGFTLADINSELLASLLASEEERENFVFDFPSYGYIQDRFDELIDQE